MSETVKTGLFYRDYTLYVGEYVVGDETKTDKDVLEENKGTPYKINGETYTSKENEKKENTIIEKKINEKKNGYDNYKTKEEGANCCEIKEHLIILQGNGKYIKHNEIYTGIFIKNEYRNGIWVKYKNIHNLFVYMNLYDDIINKYNDNNTKQNGVENLKNFLYVPLKEVNIYIGEFDNNMFNGFSLYYFYPFLYIGYFVNNSMNGHGYMFYVPSISDDDFISCPRKKNNIFFSSNYFSFLSIESCNNQNSYINNLNNKEKTKFQNEEIHCKNVPENNNNTASHNLLYNVYERIENIIKKKKSTNLESQNEKNISSIYEQDMKIVQKDKEAYFIEKMEEDIFKDFKLKIRRKNKLYKIKKIFDENKKENIFDILKYISHDNLIFQGYFYNGTYSTNLKRQIVHKKKFVELYKNKFVQKIEDIQKDIINGLPHDDLNINKYNSLYIFENKTKNSDLPFVNNTKAHLKGVDNEEKEHIGKPIDNEDILSQTFVNIIDLNLVKQIFELINDKNIAYNVEIVTDKKIFKYINIFNELNNNDEKTNYFNKCTLNLTGYYQLVVLNFKCKPEKIINLCTSKENIQSVYKIKMFLISSDKSSIIKYNAFDLFYIFVYIKNSDKKNKNKNLKKKK
ncbi:conserved Plasmodium protein, unknown function [Plasmodium vinckei vinckei]|uniref:Uncharacterized protein n=1 Tax=Plasmodium vinckei vinckei TaxID=54757 RepID=A0A449BSU8_PLAVN|nr:conserved Plasmodium protein, unknown function [Plasmodium vinckei vinckei]KEG02282.1 hypothetical protein YYE_03021 [Plasmodium vinckei vinckei]VEV56524.1 conserved Plasmodium protein, unknown function [Plasmodium vinckei vinckei]